MSKYILLLMALCFLWYVGDHRGHVELAPGVMVAEAPYQHDLSNGQAFPFQDFHIKPLADYQLKAKVLSAKSYLFGTESSLSPLDLALGWGPMSDESVVSQLNVRQGSRWYFWEAKQGAQLPVAVQELARFSANTHMIPANRMVEEQLDDVRIGDIIELSGWLVEVSSDDGWRWRSSLSREDTGNGACELFWVQSVFVHTRNATS